MEIKPKIRGWKEGILTRDITNGYEQTLHKGDTVRYKRHRSFGEDVEYYGTYQWWYINLENQSLIRMKDLLIEETK